VVLKVQFPDEESSQESDALAHWAGQGAVRLLAADSERRALLLERCWPGDPLAALTPAPALDILCQLLQRLLVSAPAGIRLLADQAATWAAELPAAFERAGAPFERRLLDAGLEVLRDLPSSQGPLVLLSQDLHAANVLRAEREPWLMIDPKALAGEREMAAAPIVRGRELGHSPSAVRWRLDRLCDELGLDRARAAGWTAAQSLAWAFDGDDVMAGHVEVARWLLRPGAG
jgi:streptomycin 6-kinase